ncbi:hypothetical protein GC173_12510 [bacterium]|nr:hypothetical protein [bacterium]
MNIRFNTAGFLAAATLLSGSAFAFAPEFTGDLPTVIITDQLPAPSSDFDLAQPGPATSGIFRHTGAFDLYNYINSGNLTSGEKAVVRWAFTETKVGSGSEESAANGTLIINDEDSVSNPPTAVDLATSALLGADGTLDFWNKDFSGTDTSLSTPPVTPFDYVSDSGHDLVASGPQERIVTIYVRGDDASVDFKAFSVITKIGEGDSISSVTSGPTSGPVDPFVDVVATTNDFSGWTQFGLDYFQVFNDGSQQWTNINDTTTVYQGGPSAALPGTTQVIYGNPNTTAGHTYAPATTPAPGATTSLTAAVSGSFNGANAAGNIPKIGLSAWEKTFAFAVDGNSVYKVRTKMARSNANFRDPYRIRVGDSTSIGQAITLYGATTTNDRAYLDTTARDHYTYMLAKTSTVGNASLQVSIDTYSLGSVGNALTNASLAGSGVVISEFEISKAARTTLGSGNVLFNRGATTVPATAAGELTLAELGTPGTSTAFAVGVAPLSIDAIGASTTRQPRTAAVNSGALNLTLGAATGATFPQQITFGSFGQLTEYGWTWASLVNFSSAVDANNPTATGTFPVAVDKLYVADVYLSSATAGTTTQFPTLRLRIQNGASQQNQSVFDLGVTTAGAGVKLATAPKVYSVIARPNGLAGTAGAQGHLFVDFYAAGLASTAASSVSRTVTIHRIVVSEYGDIVP